MEQRNERRKQKRKAFFYPIFNFLQSVSIAGSMIYHYRRSDAFTQKEWSILRLVCFLVTVAAFSVWFLSRIQLFAVLLPVQYFRAMQERRVLRKKFGDDYDDYVAGVWM